MRKLVSTVWAPALLLATGCGDGIQVVRTQGIVTRGGQPVKHLSLTFHPVDNSRPSIGRTDDEGRFDLEFDRERKGALVGKHHVTVAFAPSNPKEEMDMAAGRFKFHPDKEAILAKYGNRTTTPLSVDITSATRDLELKLD